MSVENRLLSRIIDDGNLSVLNKYNVTKSDFYQQQDTFVFIGDYFKEFGQMPSYSEVVAECDQFDYVPDVVDSVAYMCKKMKSDNAKRRSYELLQKEASEKFSKMSGSDFITWLHDETTKIKEVASVDIHGGTNFATNGAERKEMYLNSKESRTYQYIPTPYPSLTEWLGGGFELGDYVLFQAYVNTGKTWFASDIGIHAFKNGFGVLHYSPELSEKQQLQRLDTLHSHFKNSAMKLGQLSNERQYLDYLDSFNEENEVPYIVKTMKDLPKGLSLEVIEADLQANDNIKMVIIDGFNLMNHRGGDSNRNNMTNTSRRLRQLFARYGVVGVVAHQIPTSARKENHSEDETGIRIPVPPKLEQYSETSAVIQDACTVLNFDQVDGVGKILLAKARTPHVNKTLDLHVNFDEGFIYEASPVDFI